MKAKNSIRKKTKEEPLLEELRNDVSFQHYVLQKTLGDKYSGHAYIVYLNKEYVRHGDVDPTQLLKRDEVTDSLLTAQEIEETISEMNQKLGLSRDEFMESYPYEGGSATGGIDHLVFFGTAAEKGSIRHVPDLREKKKELFKKGITTIEQMDEQHTKRLLSAKGEETKASKYVGLWQQGETVIDIPMVKSMLSELTFPLFFYDYETINRPVPLLQ